MKQRRDITGLSGLGILLLLTAGLGFSPIVDGFLGIDVFFVCAGYVVTKEILKEYRSNAKHNRGYGWVSLAPIYGRRLLYFIPSAIITLVTVLAIVSVANDAKYFTGLTMDTVWAALMLANVRFIQEGVNFLSNTSSSSPILNFWAISTYVQVLLVVPLLLVASLGFRNLQVRNKRVRHRKRAILALGSIAGTALVITAVEIALEPSTAMFTASARLADFAIGGLFAAVRVNELTFGRAQILLTRSSALAVVLLSPILFRDFSQNLDSLFIAISTGFICATHSTRLPDIFSRVLGAQPLYGIGIISLQIFLWYWPILVLAHRYGFHFGYEGSVGQRMLLGVSILIVATLAHLAIRFMISMFIPKYTSTPASDIDDDDVATGDNSAEQKEVTKPATAYQKRNQVLIGAVVGSLGIVAMSAPSLIAPQVRVVTGMDGSKPLASQTAVPVYLSPRVVFLGASITSGCCTKAVPSWPRQVGQNLNWRVVNLAKSGTGFTHGNSYGICADGSCRSIAQMAVRAVTQRPDAVVVSGGRNDCKIAMANPQRAQSAINQTFDSLRVGLPNTPIIAMSVVHNQKQTVPECYSRLNRWISAAADKNNASFVPNVTSWLTGHPEYISSDQVHPNDNGHTEIARRFVDWFNQQNVSIVASGS